VSLTRALWSDFFIGSVSYTIEDVGIRFEQRLAWMATHSSLFDSAKRSTSILNQVGDHLFQRFGNLAAYDTRNSTQLPNHGQRTEFDPEISYGDDHVLQTGTQNRLVFQGLFQRPCD
jgi:hypothetical protein